MNLFLALIFAALGAAAGYLGAACIVESHVKLFDRPTPKSYFEKLILFVVYVVGGYFLAGFVAFHAGLVAGAIALGGIAFGGAALVSVAGSLLHVYRRHRSKS